MKKLMIALTAAATAFGLYADFSESQDFEAAEPVLTKWSNVTAADVVEGKHTLGESRPNAFIPEEGEEAENEKALKVATTVGAGNAVTYNFNGLDGDVAITRSIGTGLYFDGIVKFTVFDMDDTPAALASDAKIAVFMQAKDEDATESQLIVRAADKNGVAKDYVCGVDATIDEGWHRLTIKAIDAAISGKAGFVVYVDEKPATCAATKTEIPVDSVALKAYSFYDKGALFISLAAGDTLSAVAFDGQGSIAEVEVSDTHPIHKDDFAKDEGAYVLSWPVAKVASITVDGKTYKTTDYQDGKVTVIADAEVAPETITVTWVAKSGYISNSTGKEITLANNEATLLDADVDKAVADFNGTMYAKLEDAVGAQAANGKLTLHDNVEGGMAITVAGVTIDLGEYALTYKGNEGDNTAIDGSVTIDATTGSVNGNVTGETLTINGGTFEGTVTGQAINVNGGAFKNQPEGETVTLLPGKKWSKVETYWTLVDKIAVTGVTLDTKELALLAGASSEALTYKIDPQDADVDTIAWASDAVSVATVADGVVTAVAAGTATITLTINGTASDTCMVTVTEPVTEVTVTLKPGTGIASISQESVTGEPGDEKTVTLTADASIKIPVFKADGKQCSATYTVTIPEADGEITFTAIDASGDVSDDEAKKALEDQGVLPAATAKFPGKAKDLATWMEAKGVLPDAVNASNYLKASVDLNVALITEQTAVATAADTFAATGSGLTFKVALAGTPVATDKIANYVKATDDLGDWATNAHKLKPTAGTDGLVTVASTTGKAFAKVIIPTDDTINE